MKRILFFLFLFASGYSFCSCIDGGVVYLNGKSIACYPCFANMTPPSPIDSSYYYFGNDTIDPNNTVVEFCCGNSITTTYTYNGDTIIYQGSTIPAPIKTGKYSVYMYWINGGCDLTMTVSFVALNTTGISPISETKSIKILNNPIGSSIKLSTTQNITQLNIYDQLGRLQSISELTNSGNTYETNVENLAKGVYNVEVTTEENTKEYIKIVKQ
jgi:hypothetical protein